MKTALVTGGAGYLGSHLVRKLLSRGFRVTVLDNLTYGDSGVRDIRDRKDIRILEGDICNIKDVVKATKGNDVVVALAAIVGDPACALNEEETLSTNYESTKILVEISKYYGVKRIVFASSCSVYGANSGLLLNEGSWMNPVSLYARTRIMSEDTLFRTCNDVIPVILRLGTLFGQSYRMRYDLAINFLVAKGVREGKIQIFGGDQWRPFVHVRDAADAFIFAIEAASETVSRQIFNVGGNEGNRRIGELADYIRNAIPAVSVDSKSLLGDRRDYRVCFDKIENLLGFRPKHSIAEGIGEMAEFLARNGNVDYLNDIYYNVKYLYRHHV